MKTKVGHFYVFLSLDEFWEKVNYWKSKGFYWVFENHPDYNPTVEKKDLPLVLSIDSHTMGFGSAATTIRERYFSDPTFVKLYNIELRKLKLKKILE